MVRLSCYLITFSDQAIARWVIFETFGSWLVFISLTFHPNCLKHFLYILINPTMTSHLNVTLLSSEYSRLASSARYRNTKSNYKSNFILQYMFLRVDLLCCIDTKKLSSSLEGFEFFIIQIIRSKNGMFPIIFAQNHILFICSAN